MALHAKIVYCAVLVLDDGYDNQICVALIHIGKETMHYVDDMNEWYELSGDIVYERHVRYFPNVFIWKSNHN